MTQFSSFSTTASRCRSGRASWLFARILAGIIAATSLGAEPSEQADNVRDRPRVHVFVPAPEPDAPSTRQNSSATYRRVESFPENAWRWADAPPVGSTVLVLAHDLEVELHALPADPGEARPTADSSEANTAADAIENLLELAPKDRWHLDQPGADPTGLINDWQRRRASHTLQIARILETFASAHPASLRIGVTITVTCEHATITCAKTETFRQGLWVAGPILARGITRDEVPRRVFGPAVFDPAAYKSKVSAAEDIAELLMAWLETRYVQEAATAIALKHGFEPCAPSPPAEATPPAPR